MKWCSYVCKSRVIACKVSLEIIWYLQNDVTRKIGYCLNQTVLYIFKECFLCKYFWERRWDLFSSRMHIGFVLFAISFIPLQYIIPELSKKTKKLRGE